MKVSKNNKIMLECFSANEIFGMISKILDHRGASAQFSKTLYELKSFFFGVKIKILLKKFSFKICAEKEIEPISANVLYYYY